MRSVAFLVMSWAAGLGSYATALKHVRGEALSFDNWMVVGAITLVAWLASGVLVSLPVLRRLTSLQFRFLTAALLPVTGLILAIVPVWLTLGLWHGWHPRHLLSQEAALLGVLYGTSGVVLGVLLLRVASRQTA